MIHSDPTADLLLRGLLLAPVALLYVTLCVRILGLRSFSKMTSFDFVMTVAVGSLLAGAAQASDWPGFVQPLVAIGALFLTQFLLSRLRKASDPFEDFIGNQPVILMRDGEFLDEALRRTRVSRADMIAKLREANVLELSSVRAAVLESTGDVSVLHGDTLDDVLLESIARIDD